MQIVDDRGVPLVEHAVNGFGGFVSLLVGVAVDVDEGVLRPVRGRLAGKRVAVGFAFEIAVEPVDHFVAAVGIGDWVDEDHNFLADAADHGLVRNREAICQFDHGFGGSGLVGVQSGIEVIDGARGGD